LYGDDANDCSIGVELCFDSKNKKVNNIEAYNRYVWYLAYLCDKFGLNPLKDIVGHSKLDPGRKSDPENALRYIGKDFDDLILDINKELANLKPKPQPPTQTQKPKECNNCLTKQDADKIIKILQEVWAKALTDVKKNEIAYLADEVRKASAQKPQNS
jgi:hypothetical protein